MEDILEVIKSRRTIKEFLPKFVDWDLISKIVDAGRHAPSCGNIQNWKFIVVIDPYLKKQIAEAALQQYEIINAAVHIIVVADPERAERYYGLRGERLYTVQNCAAAVQNMLLEAHSLGLGTRWIGAFEEEMVKRLLHIPENIRPQAIVAVGYPREIPPKPPKFPLETQTYFNAWRLRLRDPVRYMRDFAVVTQRKLQAAREGIKQKVDEISKKLKK